MKLLENFVQIYLLLLPSEFFYFYDQLLRQALFLAFKMSNLAQLASFL